MKTIGNVVEVLDLKAEGQIVDYSVKLIDAMGSWVKGYKGKGIPIYIVDTGIYPHPDLKDNLKGGKGFVLGACSLAFWRLFDAWSYRDFYGHGTGCASIVAAVDNGIGVIGVAPEADLWAVKVLEPNSWFGSGKSLAKGVEWATEHAIKEYGYGGIISMSLGSAQDDKDSYEALKKADENGMISVAAAGNEGGKLCAPARYPFVISVAAVDKNKARAEWSNYGEGLDVSAPGVQVYSCWLNKYAIWDGTSAACPGISGVGGNAKRKYNTKLNRKEFSNLLKEGCVDLGEEGWDEKTGWGLVQSPRIAQIQGHNFTMVV